MILNWPKPYDDECLSSWLTRLARANLCDPYLFVKHYFKANLWAKDIDKYLDEKHINVLCNLTPYSKKKITRLLMPQYKFYGIESRLSNNSEITLLNSTLKGFRKTKPWLQYCPLCLKESAYYSKYWRLAHATVCPMHKLKLYDKCFKCNEPINFHRLDVRYDSMLRCDKCLELLTNAPIIKIKDTALISITQQVITASQRHWIKWQSLDMHSFLFFKGLAFLIKGIRRSIFCLLNDRIKQQKPNFTTLPLNTRLEIMRIVARLLSDWPDNIIALHKSNYISQTAFYQGTRHKWPFWLHQVMREKLSKGYCHVTEEEIIEAIRLLMKKGYAITLPNIGEVLGKDRSFKVPRRLKKHFLLDVNQQSHLMRVFSWKK